MNSRFVPATGLRWLLPWYDPLVAFFTCESHFKSHVVTQLLTQPPQRLLDVGCGSGTLLLEAHRALDATQSVTTEHRDSPQLVGIDPDAEILKQAMVKLAGVKNTTLLLAATNHIPLENDSVDVATSTLVFHHLTTDEKPQALAEIFRVLAPSGRFILVDFGVAANWFDGLKFLTVRFADGWERTRCNATGKLERLMVDAGFENLSTTAVMPTPLGTLHCYLAFKPAANSDS